MSCNTDETIEKKEYSTEIINNTALVKDYGFIPADGCGWALEMDAIDFSTFELPDKLQQDSLVLFASFQQSTDSFTCIIGHSSPIREVKNIPESFTFMYYSETQCMDRWGYEVRQVADLDAAKIINEYLDSISIEIVTLKIFKSKNQTDFCLACTCHTGRSIVIGVEEIYIDALSNIGFQEMEACDYINPLKDIVWLNELRREFNQNSNLNRITQYEYNENCVFLVEPCYDCSDALATVYDIEKNVICEFGSIAGLNTCPDFYETAKNSIELYNN